jgi:hypothetical protein
MYMYTYLYVYMHIFVQVYINTDIEFMKWENALIMCWSWNRFHWKKKSYLHDLR